MQIRVTYIGHPFDQMGGLPAVVHLEERALLSRAVDAIQRHSSHDSLLAPTVLVAINGQHAGTLAAPDHRELNDGDEILIIAPLKSGQSGE